MTSPSLSYVPLAPSIDIGAKIAKIVSACTSKPYIGPAAELLQSVANLYLGAEQNSKLLAGIVERCGDLLNSLDVSRHDSKQLKEFQNELESLLKDIKETAADWSGRYVKLFIDQDKIKSYVLEKHLEIDRLLQRFQIDYSKNLLRWQFSFISSLEEDNCMMLKIVSNAHAKSHMLLEDIDKKLSTPEAQAANKLISKLITNYGEFDPTVARATFLKIKSTSGVGPESQVTVTDQYPRAGTSLDIYRAQDFRNQELAIKTFRHSYSPEKIKTRLERVISIWNTLSETERKYILPIVGFSMKDDGSMPCIVTPWMKNGNILDYVRSNPGINKLALIYKVAKCLAALHVREVPIAHGLIKSSNILINVYGDPLLSDLFMAKFIEDDENPPMHSTPEESNLSWLAPEIRSASGKAALTTESDIYSFGMVVIEIVTGNLPYACYSPDKYTKVTDVKFYNLINEGVLPMRPQNPIVDDELWRILERCWAVDPAGRPKMPEIVKFLEANASG